MGKLHIRNDQVNVHSEPRIAMLLDRESAANIVGNTKESQHFHGLEESLFDVRVTGFPQEFCLLMKLREGLHKSALYYTGFKSPQPAKILGGGTELIEGHLVSQQNRIKN